MKNILTALLCMTFAITAAAQKSDSLLLKEIASLKRQIENQRHTHDQIIKKVDDLMWHKMLEDIAFVDKVRLTGPPRWKAKNENDK